MRFWLPAAVVAIWVAVALAAPLVAVSSDEIHLGLILEGPGAAGALGFDDLGRPLADRLLLGARTSLLVSASVVFISLVFGTGFGITAAWRGGPWDLVMVRVIDIFLAFPGILLAIALAGILGPGIDNVVVALAGVGWVGFARLARAQALSIKHREHVQAAQALGTRAPVIIARHLLPLLAAPLIVEATFAMAGIVIAEAGLSFLGLGVQPPAPSWGSMIRDGTRYVLVAPHLVLVPGIALMMVVFAVNLLGDRLRDHLDVRYRPGS